MDVYSPHSRRQFVKQALVTTGTLGLTTASGQLATRDTTQVDSGALNKFRAQVLVQTLDAFLVAGDNSRDGR